MRFRDIRPGSPPPDKSLSALIPELAGHEKDFPVEAGLAESEAIKPDFERIFGRDDPAMRTRHAAGIKGHTEAHKRRSSSLGVPVTNRKISDQIPAMTTKRT